MKRLIKISAMVLLTVLVLAGCKKSYTITVKSNNPEWGTVTGSGNYKDGETVRIAANPATGYYFIAWNDGNTSNPRDILVTGNAEYIATFSDTPGGSTEGAQELSGSISANTTLRDLGLPVDYIIDGRFYVEGNACLTIEPGVTIMFTGVNGGVTVEENAGLYAKGTADKPIVFTGPTNNPNKGAWNNVYVTSNRYDNQFEYVQFINGGSYESPVVEVPGKISMKNCTVNGGLADGVQISGSLVAFENNTVKNMNKYPLVLDKHQMANFLGAGNSFTNNTLNMIHMTASYLENTNSTETVKFTKQGIPYFFSQGIYTENAQDVMRVKEGVEMVFGFDKGIYINESGMIVVEGTAAEPVIFRGVSNDPGDWNGIEIFTVRGANGGSRLANCNIRYAGSSYDDAALVTNEGTHLVISNVSISGSDGYGMKIAIPVNDDDEYDYTDYHVLASGLTFSDCLHGNIYEENKGQILPAMPGNTKLARR